MYTHMSMYISMYTGTNITYIFCDVSIKKTICIHTKANTGSKDSTSISLDLLCVSIVFIHARKVILGATLRC